MGAATTIRLQVEECLARRVPAALTYLTSDDLMGRVIVEIS